MTDHDHGDGFTPGEPSVREFTLRGGLADGSRFKLATCSHGGWPELVLTPKGTKTDLRYAFDSAADTYVYVGQTEVFDGE
jgi:hypothetical protein